MTTSAATSTSVPPGSRGSSFAASGTASTSAGVAAAAAAFRRSAFPGDSPTQAAPVASSNAFDSQLSGLLAAATGIVEEGEQLVGPLGGGPEFNDEEVDEELVEENDVEMTSGAVLPDEDMAGESRQKREGESKRETRSKRRH